MSSYHGYKIHELLLEQITFKGEKIAGKSMSHYFPVQVFIRENFDSEKKFIAHVGSRECIYVFCSSYLSGKIPIKNVPSTVHVNAQPTVSTDKQSIFNYVQQNNSCLFQDSFPHTRTL